MTMIYTGPSDLPRQREKLYQIASAIEYRIGHFAPPKPRVLQEWAAAAEAAEHKVHRIWVAWQAFTHPAREIRRGHGLKLLQGENANNLGLFLESDENKRVWKRIQEQAIHLGARHILLETPPSFTPSEQNKQRLSNFVQNWSNLHEDLSLIWRPSGFWEREESVELCQSLELTLAFDPLIDEKEEMPPGAFAYFQMLGRHGLMDSYSDDDLEAIIDKCRDYDDVFVIFRTQDPLADALRLQQVASHFEDDDFDDDEDEEDFEDEDFDEDEDFGSDDEDFEES